MAAQRRLRRRLARWLRMFATAASRAAVALAGDRLRQPGEPPEHWLNVVRRRAPQLLEGRGIGRRIAPSRRSGPAAAGVPQPVPDVSEEVVDPRGWEPGTCSDPPRTQVTPGPHVLDQSLRSPEPADLVTMRAEPFQPAGRPSPRPTPPVAVNRPSPRVATSSFAGRGVLRARVRRLVSLAVGRAGSAVEGSVAGSAAAPELIRAASREQAGGPKAEAPAVRREQAQPTGLDSTSSTRDSARGLRPVLTDQSEDPCGGPRWLPADPPSAGHPPVETPVWPADPLRTEAVPPVPMPSSTSGLWPALPDDDLIWETPGPAFSGARIRQLDDEQRGV